MLYSTPQTTRVSSAGSQRTFLQRAPTRRSITPSRIHAPIYASSAETTNSATVQDAVSVLQAAAASSKVAPTQVFQALRDLEKAKVPTEGWNEVLGGTESPGRRWRLVFTSGTKEVQVKTVASLPSLCVHISIWRMQRALNGSFNLPYHTD
jgi:hypothetical protein